MNPLEHTDNEERIDALDHLIFRELGQQASWRNSMHLWEERSRRQRRYRLIPVLSNIASVAALFILGLIVEAMVPKMRVADSIADVPSPAATENVSGSDVTPAASPSEALPSDTSALTVSAAGDMP